MIKNVVFLITILFTMTAYSKGDCVTCAAHPAPPVNTFSSMANNMQAILNANLTAQNTNDFIVVALRYLNSIKNTKNFNDQMADAYVRRLREISNKRELPARFRARAMLVNSGIIGKLAEKRNSPNMGKESFNLMRSSMNTDPTFTDAKMAYVGAITEMSKKPMLVRRLVEGTLSISIKEEAAAAMRIIEQQRWMTNPNIRAMYNQLRSFNG